MHMTHQSNQNEQSWSASRVRPTKDTEWTVLILSFHHRSISCLSSNFGEGATQMGSCIPKVVQACAANACSETQPRRPAATSTTKGQAKLKQPHLVRQIMLYFLLANTLGCVVRIRSRPLPHRPLGQLSVGSSQTRSRTNGKSQAIGESPTSIIMFLT